MHGDLGWPHWTASTAPWMVPTQLVCGEVASAFLATNSPHAVYSIRVGSAPCQDLYLGTARVPRFTSWHGCAAHGVTLLRYDLARH